MLQIARIPDIPFLHIDFRIQILSFRYFLHIQQERIIQVLLPITIFFLIISLLFLSVSYTFRDMDFLGRKNGFVQLFYLYIFYKQTNHLQKKDIWKINFQMSYIYYFTIDFFNLSVFIVKLNYPKLQNKNGHCCKSKLDKVAKVVYRL